FAEPRGRLALVVGARRDAQQQRQQALEARAGRRLAAAGGGHAVERLLWPALAHEQLLGVDARLRADRRVRGGGVRGGGGGGGLGRAVELRREPPRVRVEQRRGPA